MNIMQTPPTFLDRILLGRVFTFRSEMRPADCAARIRQLTMQPEDDGFWKGQALKTRPGEEYYEFELYLWRQYFHTGKSLASEEDDYYTVDSQARIQGSIELSDALGSSIVSGVVYSNPKLYLYAGSSLFLLLVIAVALWQGIALQTFLWVLIVFLLLLSAGWLWTCLSDRGRTVQQLEHLLQARFRQKK